MQKRLVSAFLLFAVLATASACDNGTTADTLPDDTTEAVTDSLPAGIEKKDYGNTSVNIAYPNWGLYPNYFFSEENTGEAIGVALYNRELKVEEHLGVDITYEMQIDINTTVNTVRQNVMANEDEYQIALNHCIAGLNGMVADGLLYDLNTISTIDTTTDWWNTRSMENLEINGHQYCAINDYMIPDPNAIVFNSDFIDIYELDDPYELVRNGEWTVDNMMNMMKMVTTDNGDGNWDIEDTYGFGCPNDWFLNPFIYSSDLRLTDKDEDGLFTLAFGVNDRTALFTEKMDALFNGPDTFMYPFSEDYPGQFNTTGEKSLNLKKGRTLFGIVALNELHNYRDTTIEFGILPYPKLDSEQQDYLSLDWSGLLIVPASVKKPEMVGEVIELLAYYSDEAVLPAYYDLVLGEKLSRDEDSKEMLDIIFDGIIFDAGVNYFGFSTNVQKFFYVGNNIDAANWSGLASFTAQYENGAKAEIDTFNMKVLDME